MLDANGNKLATGQLVTTTRAKLTVHVLLTNTGKRQLHRIGRATPLRIKATFLDAAGHLYAKTTTVIFGA